MERGFGRGRGNDRGGRGGRGRGGRGGDHRGGGRGGPKEEAEWVPLTKLGRLVKSGKIASLEEIYRFALPLKESKIIDFFYKKEEGKPSKELKEEVVKIMPVQKQTQAGQRTKMKAFVLIGDCDSHVGAGQKVAKDVQGAIKGAIQDAKLHLIPVRKGYWGNNIGKPHTVPFKCSGKCGSVRIKLIPAPVGTGIVGAPTSKKVLQFAGINDCYSKTKGSTKTKGNFLYATYDALAKTYSVLTPDLWGKTESSPTPYELHAQFLKKKDNK